MRKSGTVLLPHTLKVEAVRGPRTTPTKKVYKGYPTYAKSGKKKGNIGRKPR